MAGILEKQIDRPAQGQGKAEFVVKTREIHKLQLRHERDLRKEEAPPLSSGRCQLPVALAAADEAAGAQRQAEVISAQGSPGQDFVQIPDIGRIVNSPVAAEMVQPEFQVQVPAEVFSPPGGDPVIDCALQAAVHPRVVLHLAEEAAAAQGKVEAEGGMEIAPFQRVEAILHHQAGLVFCPGLFLGSRWQRQQAKGNQENRKIYPQGVFLAKKSGKGNKEMMQKKGQPRGLPLHKENLLRLCQIIIFFIVDNSFFRSQN